MLKVVIVCDSLGATQTISFSRPLEPEITAGRVALHMVPCSTPSEAEEAEALIRQMGPNVVVFSRCTSDAVRGLIASAHAVDAAVVVHLDDDLLAVPAELGSSKHAHYTDPARMAALRLTLDKSDLIYASTNPLADRLRQHGVRTPITAGDIYCPAGKAPARGRLPSTGPVIGYMATGGHGADLELVLPAIKRLLSDIPTLRFETLGTIRPPEALRVFGARAAHYPGLANYEDFMERLNDLGWWIGIAPLADTPFNRCKADTKWVEYSTCGIPTIASDLPVYHRACASGAGALATTAMEWEQRIRTLLSDRSARGKMAALAADRLEQDYKLSILTAQILKILNQAMRRSSNRTWKEDRTP